MWNGGTLELEEGQFITGRKALSQETGIAASTCEDILKFLEKEKQIRQQTNSKFRVITILNWKDYQQTDNKATAGRQLADTNKNIKNVKKKPAPQDGALVGEVIKAFEEVDPKNKNYYGNTTQRVACSFLIKEYGYEEVLKRIGVLPRTNKIPFYPTIHTPVQLRDKWVQLQEQVQRKRAEVNNNKVKIV